jgi:hypothetical protein
VADETLSLEQINEREHALQEEDLLRLYEAVTDLAFDDASVAWSRFRRRLQAHMAFEEEHTLPALGPALAAAKSEERTVEHVDGDHRILERTVRKIDAALDRLCDEPPSRRRMVLELDNLLLIRRVLEHHTAREQRFVYPLLDEQLEAEELARFKDAFEAASRAGARDHETA